MSAPQLAYSHPQPKLPIRFDANRGCDQIRARLYHDARIKGGVFQVLMVLSEFVNTKAYAAHPKQATIARFAHVHKTHVSRITREAAELKIIEIDRKRTYCRYVFRQEWLGRFRDVSLPEPSRVAEAATQRRTSTY